MSCEDISNDAALPDLIGAEFHGTMLAEVERARHRIMTTYIRHRPPAYFLGFTDEETARAARAYFDAVVSWSQRPGRAFGAAGHRHTERRDDRLGALDDSVVLLAFTAGPAQQLNGFRFDQPGFVRCCIGYFEQLRADAGRLTT